MKILPQKNFPPQKKKNKMNPSDEDLVKWYDARDAFLGINRVERDYNRGMELAHALSTKVKNAIPEAAWLCRLFPRGSGASSLREEGVILALTADQTPTASVYLALLLDENPPLEYVRVAINSRHPLFLGVSSHAAGERMRPEILAELIEQREPRGFFDQWERDGRPFRSSDLRRAAELGLVFAWHAYGRTAFKTDNPARYYWTGKAAQRGIHENSFAVAAYAALVDFLDEHGSSACIAQIGDMIGRGCLGGRLLTQPGNVICTGPNMYVRAMRYISVLREQWRTDARDALSAWLCIGIRKRVVKDIRVLIGKRILKEWTRDVAYRPVVIGYCPNFSVDAPIAVMKCVRE
jgi:hypothetical protein